MYKIYLVATLVTIVIGSLPGPNARAGGYSATESPTIPQPTFMPRPTATPIPTPQIVDPDARTVRWYLPYVWLVRNQYEWAIAGKINAAWADGLPRELFRDAACPALLMEQEGMDRHDIVDQYIEWIGGALSPNAQPWQVAAVIEAVSGEHECDDIRYFIGGPVVDEWIGAGLLVNPSFHTEVIHPVTKRRFFVFMTSDMWDAAQPGVIGAGPEPVPVKTGMPE